MTKNPLSPEEQEKKWKKETEALNAANRKIVRGTRKTLNISNKNKNKNRKRKKK